MKRVYHFRQVIKQTNHYLLPSEFARKFSQTMKLKHSELMQMRIDNTKTDEMKSWNTTQYDKPFENFQSSTEVWEFIQSKEDPFEIFGAIRKCATMNDIPMCWKIFEHAKSGCNLNAHVFFQMISILNRCPMYRDKNTAMKLYRQLTDDMEMYVITQNDLLLTSTLSLLTKYGEYEEAHKIWKDLKESNSKLLMSGHVWVSYVSLNIKQCLAESGDNLEKVQFILKLLGEMYNEYSIKRNDNMHSTVLFGISKLLKKQIKWDKINGNTDASNRDKIIKIGERLFDECKDKVHNNALDHCYAAVIDLYGNAGDIDKCMEYLKIAVERQLEKKKMGRTEYKGVELFDYVEGKLGKNVYDERGLKSCIGSSIKAVINNESITCDEGWKLIDHITVDIMGEQCELKKDIVIYGLLFQYGGRWDKDHIDMSKLKGLYKEMLSDNIEPSNLALNNLAMAGKIKYQDDERNSDKFAKWMAKQFYKYNVPMTKFLWNQLKQMIVDNDEKTLKIMNLLHP